MLFNYPHPFVLPNQQNSTLSSTLNTRIKCNMSADADSNLIGDDFKVISYKKKLWKSKPKHLHKNQHIQYGNSLSFDREAFIRRISDAKLELSTTDLFDSVKASLKEGLSALNNPLVIEIICLGLGRIGECTIARYQFALLLCLKELYNVDVYVYDPIFTQNDIILLKHFGIIVLEENLEGKYEVRDKKTRLFYLPHCPKQISNNLLWANWGLDLSYCVIIANSFNKIIESCSTKTLTESGEYISKISPYVLELAVINSFKYYEVFNDTAVHVFPKLHLISQDLWEFCLEPKYSDEDLEFVTNKKFEQMAGKLSVLRQIISELRYALPEGNFKDNLALRYVLGQFKKYKTTDQQLCKAREEMEFMAKTYLCYLRSTRLHQEIHNEFHGKGERTVKETANLVGFKLPHDPK